MIILVVILAILLFASWVILAWSLHQNYKLGLYVLRFEEDLESCLDILDNKYRSLSILSEKPVFFDSIEVRQAINDIVSSRDAIINVANKLTSFNSTEEIEDASLEEKDR